MPMVMVAVGSSNAGRAYSQVSSWANATAATASATFWTNDPGHRTAVVLPQVLDHPRGAELGILVEIILANRGVELPTMRALRSSGQ